MTLSTHASFNGTRPDSDFLGLGLTEVDGYVRWDLSAAYRINSTVELYTNFYNLLNQDYFEVLGFPALRFHFRSGLRFHF